jgi:hypothetical protein
VTTILTSRKQGVHLMQTSSHAGAFTEFADFRKLYGAAAFDALFIRTYGPGFYAVFCWWMFSSNYGDSLLNFPRASKARCIH